MSSCLFCGDNSGPVLPFNVLETKWDQKTSPRAYTVKVVFSLPILSIYNLWLTTVRTYFNNQQFILNGFIVNRVCATKKLNNLPNILHWNTPFSHCLNVDPPSAVSFASYMHHSCMFFILSHKYPTILKCALAAPWDNQCATGYCLLHSHEVLNTTLVALLLLWSIVVQTCPQRQFHLFPVLHKELVSTVAKSWFIRVEGVIRGSLESPGLITEPSEL